MAQKKPPSLSVKERRKRKEKAIKLVLEKKISITDVDDEYKVGTHIINAVKGCCTCLTFMYQGKMCSHVFAVELFLAEIAGN